MKQIILLIITIMLAAAPAMQANAASSNLGITDIAETQSIKIEQRGNVLIITGAQGKTLQVFDIVGVEVINLHIEQNEKRVDISRLRKGIYPVKVGSVTKKIYINGR